MSKKVKKSDLKKSWNKKKSSERRARGNRDKRNTFLIYCEGESSEPAYFRAFPVNTETKVIPVGVGKARSELIRYAIKDVEERERDKDRQVWCVFDKDGELNDGRDRDFDSAVELALKKGFKVAYSIDSFELWFILHFRDYSSPTDRRERYYNILSKLLGYSYSELGKKKRVTGEMYKKLLSFQPEALNRAEKLFKRHLKEGNEKNYSRQTPVTTVYRLVNELNKCLKP